MMLFNEDDRRTTKTLTLNEFNFIKARKDFLIKTINQSTSNGIATTEIYDFLNLYMPGFYECFYFHMCYVNVIDTRTQFIDRELLNSNLTFCKQYYEKLGRLDLYEQLISKQGIMFLIDDKYLAFNSYQCDIILVSFFIFVNKFKSFDKYLQNVSSFLQYINFVYCPYYEIIPNIDQSFLLFGKPKIEHY